LINVFIPTKQQISYDSLICGKFMRKKTIKKIIGTVIITIMIVAMLLFTILPLFYF